MVRLPYDKAIIMALSRPVFTVEDAATTLERNVPERISDHISEDEGERQVHKRRTNSRKTSRTPSSMLSNVTAITAILLGLGLGLSRASPFDQRDSLLACLEKAEVPTDSLGTDEWKLDVAPFNLELNYTPVAIAVPANVKHIQDAVACAAKLGVKANAKCGGHSYASFGLGGEDGHLTIEMDRMNTVKLDTASGIASVEGGSRLGHVATELYSQGKRAFSHGTCPGYVHFRRMDSMSHGEMTWLDQS